MTKKENISDQEALSNLSTAVRLLCSNYGVEFNRDRVDLLFMFAKEDVENGKFSWDTFFRGFKEAGKQSDYFPTYSKILDTMHKLTLSPPKRTAPENRQLAPGSVLPIEQARARLAEIKAVISKI